MSFTPSCADGACHCRMFCRPIATGNGEVTVRPIAPGDADMAQGFMGNLSATARYFRFFQPVKVLPPRMLEHFVRVDHRTHLSLVGLARINGRQGIVGEARYAVNHDGATADIAVAVADRWQRLGIATGLLAMLEGIAASAGVIRLTGESFAVNATFLDFARACGFRVQPDAGDRSFVRIAKDIRHGFRLDGHDG